MSIISYLKEQLISEKFITGISSDDIDTQVCGDINSVPNKYIEIFSNPTHNELSDIQNHDGFVRWGIRNDHQDTVYVWNPNIFHDCIIKFTPNYTKYNFWRHKGVYNNKTKVLSIFNGRDEEILSILKLFPHTIKVIDNHNLVSWTKDTGVISFDTRWKNEYGED